MRTGIIWDRFRCSNGLFFKDEFQKILFRLCWHNSRSKLLKLNDIWSPLQPVLNRLGKIDEGVQRLDRSRPNPHHPPGLVCPSTSSSPPGRIPTKQSTKNTLPSIRTKYRKSINNWNQASLRITGLTFGQPTAIMVTTDSGISSTKRSSGHLHENNTSFLKSELQQLFHENHLKNYGSESGV
jgi:hypothetical protein